MLQIIATPIDVGSLWCDCSWEQSPESNHLKARVPESSGFQERFTCCITGGRRGVTKTSPVELCGSAVSPKHP